MSDRTLRLICAADLHIGRRASRLGDAGSDRLSASAAWRDLVACAIAEGVDAVLLAGDIVDQDNRFFEAYGPVQDGVRRLRDARIPVVAVAGNHDFRTLHDVAAEVGQGHLVVLGRGGQWERWTLRDDAGNARLHVDGWSFPGAQHVADPTAHYDLPAPVDDAPVVGLLHCDLDASEPRYAPVASARLRTLPPRAWVLGHVHAPLIRDEAGQPPLAYPGSLLALDPGERGAHGAVLLEIGGARAAAFRAVPLSRVRYGEVVVDVSAAGDEAGLRACVTRALRAALSDIADAERGPLEVFCCRLRLTGRTPLHARIEALLGRIAELAPHEAHVRFVVEGRVVNATEPAIDLGEIARGNDAPALLARMVHGPIDTALRQRVERLLVQLRGRSDYVRVALPAAGIESSSPAARGDGHDAGGIAGSGADHLAGVDPDALLRRQAAKLLDQLLRQKEPA